MGYIYRSIFKFIALITCQIFVFSSVLIYFPTISYAENSNLSNKHKLAPPSLLQGRDLGQAERVVAAAEAVPHNAPAKKPGSPEQGVVRVNKAVGQLTIFIKSMQVKRISHKFASSPRPEYTTDEIQRINANLNTALATWEAYLKSKRTIYIRDRFAPDTVYYHEIKTRFFVDPNNEFYISNPGDSRLEIDDEWTKLPAILQSLLINHEVNQYESLALAEDLVFYSWIKKNRSSELEAALRAHPELKKQPYFAFLRKNHNKSEDKRKRAIVRFMMQEELRQAERLMRKGKFKGAADILEKLRDTFVGLCFEQGSAKEAYHIVPDLIAPAMNLLRRDKDPALEEFLERVKYLISESGFRHDISYVWELICEREFMMADSKLKEHKGKLKSPLLSLYNICPYKREEIDLHTIRYEVSIGKIYYAMDKNYRDSRLYISLGSISEINFFLGWSPANGDISLIKASNLAFMAQKGDIRILGPLETDKEILDKQERFLDISPKLERLIEDAVPRVGGIFHKTHYVVTLNEMVSNRTSTGRGHAIPLSKSAGTDDDDKSSREDTIKALDLEDAATYMREAEAFLRDRKYPQASEWAKFAIDIYDRLNETELVAEARRLLSKIEEASQSRGTIGRCIYNIIGVLELNDKKTIDSTFTRKEVYEKQENLVDEGKMRSRDKVSRTTVYNEFKILVDLGIIEIVSRARGNMSAQYQLSEKAREMGYERLRAFVADNPVFAHVNPDKPLRKTEIESLLDISRVIHITDRSLRDPQAIFLDVQSVLHNDGQLIDGIEKVLHELSSKGKFKLFVVGDDSLIDILSGKEINIYFDEILPADNPRKKAAAIKQKLADWNLEYRKAIFIGVHHEDILAMKDLDIVKTIFLQERMFLGKILEANPDYLANGPINWQAELLIQLGI